MESLGYSLLIALLPLLYLLKSHISAANRGLRLPPGPWQLPVIGNLHQLSGGLLHRVLRDMSRRYGPIMFFKVGEVPMVVVSSREAAREVMKTHDAIFATRPQTPTVKAGGPGLIFAPYGEQWRQFRKISMLELLSARRVHSFQPVRGDEAARLVRSVAASPPPRLVDLTELLTTYVMDATVRCIMGDRIRDRATFLRELEKDIQSLSGFHLADVFPSSWAVRALSPIMSREADAHHRVVQGLMDGVLREHMRRRSQQGADHREQDLIDVLVRIQREEGNLTTDAIKGLIHDLFSAGSETAAVTLQWAMAELMRNPEVMRKAQGEVRAVFATEVAEDGLERLAYLRQVVQETLRLHPPVALLIPRECQQQCRVLGYDVPRGATVLVNAWAISRDPEYWEEPEAFRPERFEGGKVDFKGNDFEFTPFGAGRRICPGISFAVANIDVALANLLFHFDWSLPDGVECSDLDMTETSGLSNRRKSQLLLKAVPYVPQPR